MIEKVETIFEMWIIFPNAWFFIMISKRFWCWIGPAYPHRMRITDYKKHIFEHLRLDISINRKWENVVLTKFWSRVTFCTKVRFRWNFQSRWRLMVAPWLMGASHGKIWSETFTARNLVLTVWCSPLAPQRESFIFVITQYIWIQK